MTDLALISTGISVKSLLGEIHSQSELWNEITERESYPGTAHADTRSIFLRWCKTRTIEAAFTEIAAVDYPAFEKLPTSRGLIESIFEQVRGEKLGRAMIVMLKPGGRIKPHIDEGSYADHYERFHLCLRGSCLFKAGWDIARMSAGELWWFNHKTTHEVVNDGKQARLHLIVDIVAPKYRRERENRISRPLPQGRDTVEARV